MKKKEGVSIKEIEFFTKKHQLEVFFCLLFVLTCFFSFVFFGPGWAVVLSVIGCLIGIVFQLRVEVMSKSIWNFVFKQERTTQLVLGAVGLIIAVFLPPIIFFLVGLHGGKSMYNRAKDAHAFQESKKE